MIPRLRATLLLASRRGLKRMPPPFTNLPIYLTIIATPGV